MTFSEGEAGPFGWHVGAGGGGIKDDSPKVKVEGLGVQVGQKMGMSQ